MRSDAQSLPTLHHASAIRADTELARTITALVNDGYQYISPHNASRWHASESGRLSTPNAIHEALGHDGFFAVAYDARDKITPVACAAAKRWTHDLEGCTAGGETGWEIITVTTQVGWRRRGLAERCIDAIVAGLVGAARAEGDEETVQVWVQAIEDTNGLYWRKKGWRDVRAYEKAAGHWGSKCGYRLLVMVQEYTVKRARGL